MTGTTQNQKENGYTPTPRARMSALHLVLIAGGALLMLSGCLHSAVWFDESYSVGMANLGFADMIKTSVADVHPPLYYILLWLFTAVTGKSIIAMRIFSALCAVALGALGYTHIRRDFGARTGFYFTLLVFLLGSVFIAASEIRMYTLAPLLVALMLIYAYRYASSGLSDTRSRVLYIVFALLAAYTHWYALAAAVMTALFFLVCCIEQKRIVRYLVDAAFLLVPYIPGFIIFYEQQARVSTGFWISFEYPDILFETLGYFSLGYEPTANWLYAAAVTLAGVAVLFVVLFLLFGLKDRRRDFVPAILAGLLPLLVIAGALIVSERVQIYHVRYAGVLVAPIIFALAFTLARVRLRVLRAAFPLLLAVVLVFRLVPLYTERYASEPNADSGMSDLAEIAGDILETDAVISGNINVLGPVMVTAKAGSFYFYNPGWWSVEEAYHAFSPRLVKCVSYIDWIDDIPGRVWVLGNGGDTAIIDGLQAAFGEYRLADSGYAHQTYCDIQFDWYLYEKVPA